VHYVSTEKIISNAHVQQTSEDTNNILNLNKRMRDMGAYSCYENRKNPKTVREVRKMPAVYCMESYKDCASIQIQIII